VQIKHSLDKNNTLYCSKVFPTQYKNRKIIGHNALLGIGGNIGDCVRRFTHLFYFLQKSSFVTIIETSPILKNPPFGYIDQNDFFNAVIHIKTMLNPKQLLEYTQKIEDRFGRIRHFDNAPRTLDIDILFFDDQDINSKNLIVPHPHWQERESVLIPLKKMKGVKWLKRHL